MPVRSSLGLLILPQCTEKDYYADRDCYRYCHGLIKRYRPLFHLAQLLYLCSIVPIVVHGPPASCPFAMSGQPCAPLLARVPPFHLPRSCCRVSWLASRTATPAPTVACPCSDGGLCPRPRAKPLGRDARPREASAARGLRPMSDDTLHVVEVPLSAADQSAPCGERGGGQG